MRVMRPSGSNADTRTTADHRGFACAQRGGRGVLVEHLEAGHARREVAGVDGDGRGGRRRRAAVVGEPGMDGASPGRREPQRALAAGGLERPVPVEVELDPRQLSIGIAALGADGEPAPHPRRWRGDRDRPRRAHVPRVTGECQRGDAGPAELVGLAHRDRDAGERRGDPFTPRIVERAIGVQIPDVSVDPAPVVRASSTSGAPSCGFLGVASICGRGRGDAQRVASSGHPHGPSARAVAGSANRTTTAAASRFTEY